MRLALPRTATAPLAKIRKAERKNQTRLLFLFARARFATMNSNGGMMKFTNELMIKLDQLMKISK
jgi:hypothetical protein